MAEAVVEKEPCVKCGAEVREGTTFCYACGGRVAPDGDEDPRTDTDINANANTLYTAATRARFSSSSNEFRNKKYAK